MDDADRVSYEVSAWRSQRDMDHYSQPSAVERRRAEVVAQRAMNGRALVNLSAAALNEVDQERERLAKENPRISREVQRLEDEFFIGLSLNVRRYMNGL